MVTSAGIELLEQRLDVPRLNAAVLVAVEKVDFAFGQEPVDVRRFVDVHIPVADCLFE